MTNRIKVQLGFVKHGESFYLTANAHKSRVVSNKAMGIVETACGEEFYTERQVWIDQEEQEVKKMRISKKIVELQPGDYFYMSQDDQERRTVRSKGCGGVIDNYDYYHNENSLVFVEAEVPEGLEVVSAPYNRKSYKFYFSDVLIERTLIGKNSAGDYVLESPSGDVEKISKDTTLFQKKVFFFTVVFNGYGKEYTFRLDNPSVQPGDMLMRTEKGHEGVICTVKSIHTTGTRSAKYFEGKKLVTEDL